MTEGTGVTVGAQACASCGGPLPPGARFCPACGGVIRSSGPDERRPVTILFVDIVGSTALAERLDAEDWKAIVDPALAGFAAAIERHEGHVAQLLGDGLLAMFGAPVAHEDDPMRAVRAGLQLIATLAERPISADAGTGPPVALRARVGICSGEVVVGAVGGSGHREYLAVGDAVNVAARLQSAAAPMTVLVDEQTFRRVATEVEGRERGGLRLAGKADEVRAVEVVAVRDDRARGRPVRAHAPFVGREAELAALQAAAGRLRQGTGVVIRISGEPGLGKTRLVAEWRRSAGEGARSPGWIQVGCRTTGRDLPYDVAAALVRGALGIPDGAGDVAARRALRRVMPQLGERDAAPLLAWLVGLAPTRAEAVVLARLEGRTRQVRAAGALRALLEALARRAPLVAVVEDAHWIDPSSAELLAVALEAVRNAPVVIAVTLRPEAAPGVERLARGIAELPAAAHVEVELPALGDAAQAALETGLLGGGTMPQALGDLVRNRCDGNPLFIEELVAVLLDRDELRLHEGTWTLTAEGNMPVPPGLLGLLVARLDALPGPVRRLALIGSVLGRSAPLTTIRAVAAAAGEPEAAAVGDPVGAAGGLLAATGDRNEVVAFRHALVHDAAYSMLARRDRSRLHGAVARHLEGEATAAGRLGEAAAALSRHFALAGDHAPAARHARLAAERAADQYANAEALALYQVAVDNLQARLATAGDGDAAAIRAELAELLSRQGLLEMLDGRYQEGVRLRRESLALVPLEPSVTRAVALMRLASSISSMHDYDEENRLHVDAEATLEAVLGGRDAAWWSAWIDIRSERASLAYWRGRTDELADHLAALEEPVRACATTEQRVTYEDMWVLYLHRRDAFAPSAEVIAHARASYDADIVSDRLDTVAWAHFGLGFALVFDRDVEEAIDHLRRALEMAPRVSDALLEARAATYLAVAFRLAGRAGDAALATERGIEVSRRLDIDQYVAAGLANRAWLHLLEGDVAGARELATSAASLWPAEPPLPLRWLDAWPAIAADMALGEPEVAVPRCRLLLERGQWPPAPPVADALRAVVVAADARSADLRPLIGQALDLARSERYL